MNTYLWHKVLYVNKIWAILFIVIAFTGDRPLWFMWLTFVMLLVMIVTMIYEQKQGIKIR
jgi:uncharacterized membrane protein YhaH (DUF805 family)